jgi:hypothetical protein
MTRFHSEEIRPVRDHEQTPLRIPLDWVIVDALGALLTGAGVYGLLGAADGPLPMLSQPGVAWLCIVFGVGLMILAMTKIFRRVMQQIPRGSGGQASRGRK